MKMRMRMVVLFISFCLAGTCIGCDTSSKQSGEEVLYMLSQFNTMRTVKKSDGNCTIDGFQIEWNDRGCNLKYEENDRKKEVQISVNQEKIINRFAIPINLEYDFFLTNEAGHLPDSWNEMFEENKRKEQERTSYGTMEGYADSRNREFELSIIQNAFDQAGLNQKADTWYQSFVTSTWMNGDFSIEIIDARAKQDNVDNYVELTLTDRNGCEMLLCGFNSGFVDLIFYRGELYAGPYTG